MAIDIEIREKIVNEYLNGKKISDIAKEFDISKQSVLNILKEKGVYVQKSLSEIIEAPNLELTQRSEEEDKGITSESLNKKIKELEEELEKNRKKIDFLTNENEDLKKKLNSLKKGNDDLTKQINFLDEEKKNLENQAISLRDENKKLNSTITDLTLKNTRLVKEKNDFYTSNKRKEGTIKKLERDSGIEIIIIFILVLLIIIFYLFNI